MKQIKKEQIEELRFTFIIMLMAVGLAGEVRAQSVSEVDYNLDNSRKTEPAIAVKYWDHTSVPSNGKTLVAAYIDGNNVATAATTDAGITWSYGSIPTPSVISSPTNIDDEKLAYRLDATGNPELIAAFRCYGNDEGTFVNFYGGSWETPCTVDYNSSWSGDDRTSRPSLITDNNSSSPQYNNAYVAWTKLGIGTDNHVWVGTFASGSQVMTNKYDLADGTATTAVDACDIAIANNGDEYVLWRSTETDVTPNIRTLYVGRSTDAGVHWNSYMVVGASPRPDKDHELVYQDAPCLAISNSNCTGENIFVSYTQLVSGQTDNSTDIFLTSTSTPVTSMSTWSTPTNILADDITQASDGNSNAFSFQFEPTMCADGAGGVFMLYYSAQDEGTPKIARAVLLETNAQQQVLSNFSSNNTSLTNDYIGIVWNSTLKEAHCIWTDNTQAYPSSSGIYTYSTGSSSSGPPVTNPAIGDLGFSNQRRIVMTGSTSHIVGFGNTGNSNAAILYSEQSSNSNGTANAWISPIEIDNNDEKTIAAVTNNSYEILLSSPATAAYEYQNGTSPKAVAIVWTSSSIHYVPPVSLLSTPPPNAYNPYLYIRVKEFEDCDMGSIVNWSLVDSIELPSAASDGYTAPVVAPLTVPVSSSPQQRYLLGWVITFPGNSTLNSITYLRGQQTGTEGYDPEHYVETENESWGPHQGSWSSFSTLIASGTIPSLSTSSFVTVTSNESNGNGSAIGNADLTQEVVFTNDGTKPNADIWDLNVTYQTAIIPSTAPHPWLGEAMGAPYRNTSIHPLDAPPPPKLDFTLHGVPYYIVQEPQLSYDRNPSVTITSTGQKIAAWEHLECPSDPFQIGIGPSVRGGPPPIPCPSNLLYIHASIRVRETDKDGTDWWPTIDVITGSANTLNFFNPRYRTTGWLINPSITAFPKTTLTDATTGPDGLDQDPGAAELLFWQQNELTISGCTVTPGTAYKLHERHFFEPKGDSHAQFDGAWNFNDPIGGKPAWPANGITGIPGANAQRSFGIYNTGPQYHLTPTGNINLYRDAFPATDLYYTANSTISSNGLSYGIGNEVSTSLGVTTIKPTIAASTADIGALKGTFDTALGVQLYRSETRVKDSSTVTFKWGKIYVEDSANGLPIREVMLHNGFPDSGAFVSNDAIRDSIFATEWFNWPVSAEIKYDRLMMFQQAGTLNYAVNSTIDTNVVYDSAYIVSSMVYDTIVADTTLYVYSNSSMVYDTTFGYDTLYDSTTHLNVIDTIAHLSAPSLDTTYLISAYHIDSSMVYDTVRIGATTVYDTIRDTVPGTFAVDSTRRTDTCFIGSGISMKYTIQLIHANGHIDTVEQLIYDPYDSLYIWPLTMTIDNAGYSDDTVMLRVLGTMTGIPDADSDVGFERESMLDTYPSWGNTTVAVGTGGGILPPPDTCFYAAGPYSNPSEPLANDVSILVHYCGSPSMITAQVYTSLGSPVGGPSTYLSDGQTWDRLPITSPSLSGTYYITVIVGSYSTTLGYTVF